MTIEIRGLELEALIRERMRNGGFQNVEDALLDALKTAPCDDVEAKAVRSRVPQIGVERGEFTVPDSFFEPLPDNSPSHM